MHDGRKWPGCEANPYTTYQPELIISYLHDGWNLSAAMYEEFNTENRDTKYTTGNIFHVDITATKTLGKWTFGPVAYYVAQVTDNLLGLLCRAWQFHLGAHRQVRNMGSRWSRRV